jgi:hypothetical protein
MVKHPATTIVITKPANSGRSIAGELDRGPGDESPRLRQARGRMAAIGTVALPHDPAAVLAETVDAHDGTAFPWIAARIAVLPASNSARSSVSPSGRWRAAGCAG